ncbi:XapX domain-containing protein [Chimaeribacter coloradensis]|uniref:XapX domain-containing protein n=1 Tax=Chimaeribacter coloradensis TaxID=2060068 RepID=A0A2N5E5K7_9GAMM|nr:DUF1427 family protein [Chimaeribacter coloradensis]PLR36431.1 XapX domain-containing protein [Chimaeribacter coloradensis]
MTPFLISLGAGVFIGLVYTLLKVRSPAPPAVALVGLLGMLIGSTLGGTLLHPAPLAAAAPQADARPAASHLLARQAD